MPSRHCSWGTCNSDSRKNDPEVFFIPFPSLISHARKARRWVELCGRGSEFTVEDLSPDKAICNLHFPIGSDFDIIANPGLEPKAARLVTQQRIRKPPLLRVLEVSNKPESNEESHGTLDLSRAKKTYQRISTNTSFKADQVVAYPVPVDSPANASIDLGQDSTKETADVGVETDSRLSGEHIIFNQREEIKNLETKIRQLEGEIRALNVKENIPPRTELDEIWKALEKFHFYTGLHKVEFDILISFLGPAVNQL